MLNGWDTPEEKRTEDQLSRRKPKSRAASPTDGEEEKEETPRPRSQLLTLWRTKKGIKKAVRHLPIAFRQGRGGDKKGTVIRE